MLTSSWKKIVLQTSYDFILTVHQSHIVKNCGRHQNIMLKQLKSHHRSTKVQKYRQKKNFRQEACSLDLCVCCLAWRSVLSPTNRLWNTSNDLASFEGYCRFRAYVSPRWKLHALAKLSRPVSTGIPSMIIPAASESLHMYIFRLSVFMSLCTLASALPCVT